VIEKKYNNLICFLVFMGSILFSANVVAEQDKDVIPQITITEKRSANELPAAIKELPISALRYHPQIDLQTRGIAETQADISIRGGIFENTGVKVGALNLFDPQTGHYTAGLPIPIEAIESTRLLTGIDNTLYGFNSAVATIAYELNSIKQGGSFSLGVGTDAFRLADVFLAKEFENKGESVYATSVSYSDSQGDGSRENGDHELSQGSVHLQRHTQQSQSDLLISYQDKFFAWPGAYTGFASLPEIDRTQTGLLLFNHKQTLTNDDWIEFGSYFRALDDDYDFNRVTLESGTPGSFEHKTESYAFAVEGQRKINSLWSLNYASQFTGDELVRSTDLLGGDFNKRQYLSLSLVPSRTWSTSNQSEYRFRSGVNYAWSNEDSGELLPVLGLARIKVDQEKSHTLSLEYSASSQLPGYTVLKSGVSGLFGGNPNLGRERTDTLELSSQWLTKNTQTVVNVFYRQDSDLVDWTFSSSSPFARQANAVDIDVLGLEALWQKDFEMLSISAAYAYLDKNANYGSSLVDASYYALNFAKHRLTSSLIWQVQDELSLKFDLEARSQEANALRAESDDAFEASFAVVWRPEFLQNLRLDLIADNITNSNFQEFPGTPSTRRSIGLRAKYSW